MLNIQIDNEEQLISMLKKDIDNCNKKNIKLLCGHFPLNYNIEKRECFEDLGIWGIFSKYTLEIGCTIAKYAKSKGKNVKLLLIVDDYTYTPKYYWAKLRRERLYKSVSGKNAKLPKVISEILSKFGLSEKDILRHNHQKKGREECLYFSENILRTSRIDIENLCARELFELFENSIYTDKKNDYIITFVPDKCSSNVCNYVLDKTSDVSGSHVFMFTDELFRHRVDRKSIYLPREDGLMMGVRYRRS